VFEGVTVETRECGQGKGRGGCITRQLGGGARATICSCNQDNCNGGVVDVEAFQRAGFTDSIWAIVGLLSLTKWELVSDQPRLINNNKGDDPRLIYIWQI
jgi:hypothetical protein